MRKFVPLSLALLLPWLLSLRPAPAAVVAVEPGFSVQKLADSGAPLHPTQELLDTGCAFVNQGRLESIAVDPRRPFLYLQVASGPTTCILSLDPISGETAVINGSTNFVIVNRGTDLILDPATNLLLTADFNLFPRIAAVDPVSGATSTYARTLFPIQTLGLEISEGIGATDVPAGELMYVTDETGAGIYSIRQGDMSATLHTNDVVNPGDDLVLQPDGDWIHVEDNGFVRAHSPVAPHLPLAASPESNPALFARHGRQWLCGSRATVDDDTGEIYLSYSCSPGGDAIFRLSEDLQKADLVVQLDDPDRLQDLAWGPSSDGTGASVYFTVHEAVARTEEVWELRIGEDDDPEPPVCDAGGPYESECAGPRTSLLLDGTGSRSSDGSPLVFTWSSDCPDATFDDAFADQPTLTLTSDPSPVDCDAFLTVTDANGLSSDCSAPVSVRDTEEPGITCGDDLVLETGPDDDDCLVSEPIEPPRVEDTCDAEPFVGNDAPASFGPGDTVVTWTARDDSGNAASCRQVVTVVDTTAPRLDCGGPRTLFTGPGDDDCLVENSLDPPQASDNCDDDPTVTSDAPAFFGLGTTVVTWTARDETGNQASCTQEVTVVDDTPPGIACDPAVTLSTGPGDDDCLVENSLDPPEASDNCDDDPQVSSDAPAFFGLGTTVVTWTARDEAGNQASCTQEVTVVDDTPPGIACDPAVTLSTGPGDDDCLVENSLDPPEASDNCDDDPQVSSDAPAFFGLGTTVVTWTARDEAGNQASCTQEVTVVDDTPPGITCDPAVTLSTGPGDDDCLVENSLDPPEVSDNCDDDPQVSSDAPAFFGLGTTVVTWTARDEEGNQASCTQEVTVVDDTPPDIACAPAVVLETGPDDADCLVENTLPPPPVSDNCDADPTVTSDAPALFPLGTTLVTWTARDEAGNTSACLQEVTVVDTTPPVVEDVVLDPDCLWPPNHRMVPYLLGQDILVEARDNCDDDLAPMLLACASDEPENAPGVGDGNTAPDCRIEDDLLEVRAERDGTGDGRIYTVTIGVVDDAGNAGRGSGRITVPHDRSDRPKCGRPGG